MPDQKLPDLMVHEHGLIFDGSYRDKAHERPRYRLADRRCISGVILLTANIGLYVGWRHETGSMAEGTTARLVTWRMSVLRVCGPAGSGT